MSTQIKQLFKDHTAWFSESVVTERKSQWKALGGLETDFETAQFIFSENAESQDTERIYKSAAYQDEHLSVFHASYITACFKAPNDKIPVGKYFMPPTEIQNLVRQQMKYIWDDKDSGVSSEEEENRGVSGSSHEQNMLPTDHSIKTPTKQTGRSKSIVKDSTTKSANKEQNTTLSPKKKTNQISSFNNTDDSPSKTCGTPSYSLRKRTKKDYSEMPYIDVNNMVLDNVKPATMHSNSQSKVNSHLPARNDHNQDFFRIEDLPKVTSEMEDLVPGENGFEVLAKT